MPFLKKINDSVSQVIPLQRGITSIGRSSQCHLELSSLVVSKLHAVIECDDDRCTLENRGVNGTLLNGVRLTEIATLKHDDTFQVGSSVFVFLQEDSAELSSEINSGGKPFRIVDGTNADPEESIRRQAVQAGSSVTRREFSGTSEIGQEKIRACVSLLDQSLATLATTDSVRKLSQVLRFSESLWQFVRGAGLQCIFNAIHQMFPQSTQIVLATEFSADMATFRVLGTSCRTESGSALICDDVIHRVVTRSECLLVSDQWRNAPTEKPRLSTMGLISLLCVPIQAPGNRCIGAIQLIASAPNPEFERGDLERLAILAQLLTIVLPESG